MPLTKLRGAPSCSRYNTFTRQLRKKYVNRLTSRQHALRKRKEKYRVEKKLRMNDSFSQCNTHIFSHLLRYRRCCNNVLQSPILMMLAVRFAFSQFLWDCIILSLLVAFALFCFANVFNIL